MGRTVEVRGRAYRFFASIIFPLFCLQLTVPSQAESAHLVWEKTGSPKIREYWSCLAGMDGRGGVLLCGSGSNFLSDLGGNPFAAGAQVIARWHAKGGPDWASAYAPVAKQSIVSMEATAVDSADNVYVAGSIYEANPDGSPNLDILVRKIDRRGRQLWADRFDLDGEGTGLDTVASVALDGVGGVFVAGSSQPGAGVGTQVLTTIHYSGDGDRLWVAHHSSPDLNEEAVAVKSDRQGGVYVAGKVFPVESGGAVLLHYGPTGDLLWQAAPEGVSSPYGPNPAAAGLAVDKQGGAYLVVDALDGFDSFTLLKYDVGGSQLWRREDLVSGGRAKVVGIDTDWRGQIVVGASIHDGRSGYAVTTFSARGELRGKTVYEARSTELLFGSQMALDDYGNVYMTGLAFPKAGGKTKKHTTLKLNAAGDVVWRFDFGGSKREMVDLPRLAVSSKGIVAVSGITRIPTVTNNGIPITVQEPAIYVIR